MIQATTFGRLSTAQTPTIHSVLITTLTAAAFLLPPAYVVAVPALLVVGVHLVRTSATGTSRRLGWLAIFSGMFVLAIVVFALVAVHSGFFSGLR